MYKVVDWIDARARDVAYTHSSVQYYYTPVGTPHALQDQREEGFSAGRTRRGRWCFYFQKCVVNARARAALCVYNTNDDNNDDANEPNRLA